MKKYMEPVRIPITEVLHKNRRMIAVVSTIVIIVTVSVFLGLSLNSASTINVMGVEVQIHYTGTNTGCFGNAEQNFTWNVKTLSSGEVFHFSLKLTNHGNTTHAVESLSLRSGSFHLVSLSEPTPAPIAAHASQTIVLTIMAPEHSYVGTIQVNIMAN